MERVRLADGITNAEVVALIKETPGLMKIISRR